MTTLRLFATAFALCGWAIGDASAQMDRTGTGGGPLSTEKAPHPTTSGQTKPPGGEVRPTSTPPLGGPKSDRAIDAATRRVCFGCISEPTESASASATNQIIRPQTNADIQLKEIHVAPKPQRQTDLDTVALASAHREQAKSTEEKTNGLWQSWLVSVCDGCGDQKPAKALRREDMPVRDLPNITGSIGRRPPRDDGKSHAARPVEIRHHNTLAADLSPENVDSIRRMPQE